MTDHPRYVKLYADLYNLTHRAASSNEVVTYCGLDIPPNTLDLNTGSGQDCIICTVYDEVAKGDDSTFYITPRFHLDALQTMARYLHSEACDLPHTSHHTGCAWEEELNIHGEEIEYTWSLPVHAMYLRIVGNMISMGTHKS